MKPTLPQAPDLDVSPIPRLPDPAAFVASLAHLGLGGWEGDGGLYRLALYRPSGVRVEVRGTLTRLAGQWVMDVELRVSGPDFGLDSGQALRRDLHAIPWTDAAPGDLLRLLERYKLPALVAALEV